MTALLCVRLGNSYGVSWSAFPVADRLLRKQGPERWSYYLENVLPREPRILEKLTDLLRDPWYNVHWAAARALGDLGEPAAIAALEAFGNSLSAQEQATVNRIVDDLRAKDKVDGSAQQKQLDELRDKVRTLEQQLQTLTARLEEEAKAEVD